MKTKRLGIALLLLVLCSCAGLSRSCSSCWAGAAGANWIVVQMDAFGRVMRCWELHGVSIANEESSDGIYWKSGDGHLVHISGFYNRVQVEHDGWGEAFKELGMTKEICKQARKLPRTLQAERGIAQRTLKEASDAASGQR
jgi:hypothetical protein